MCVCDDWFVEGAFISFNKIDKHYYNFPEIDNFVTQIVFQVYWLQIYLIQMLLTIVLMYEIASNKQHEYFIFF